MSMAQSSDLRYIYKVLLEFLQLGDFITWSVHDQSVNENISPQRKESKNYKYSANNDEQGLNYQQQRLLRQLGQKKVTLLIFSKKRL